MDFWSLVVAFGVVSGSVAFVALWISEVQTRRLLDKSEDRISEQIKALETQIGVQRIRMRGVDFWQAGRDIRAILEKQATTQGRITTLQGKIDSMETNIISWINEAREVDFGQLERDIASIQRTLNLEFGRAANAPPRYTVPGHLQVIERYLQKLESQLPKKPAGRASKRGKVRGKVSKKPRV